MILLPIISNMSMWPDILKRARAGTIILDLGCCFGQNLGLLAANGVETASMYAIHISSEFWSLSFDLFREGSKTKATFIHRDTFDQSLRLQQLEGKIDIILVCQLLHLFGQEHQILATKSTVQLFRPGSVALDINERTHSPILLPVHSVS